MFIVKFPLIPGASKRSIGKTETSKLSLAMFESRMVFDTELPTAPPPLRGENADAKAKAATATIMKTAISTYVFLPGLALPSKQLTFLGRNGEVHL